MSRQRAKSPFIPSKQDMAALGSQSRLVMAMRSLPDANEKLEGPLTLHDLPTHIDGVRVAISESQIREATRKLAFLRDKDVNSYAENSRRGMRSDWRHWMAFCASHDRVAMPIALDDVCEFIDALIAAGYQRATLQHLIFTLNTTSQIWSCPSPFDDRLWKDYWRDRCRTSLSKLQHQASPLNIDNIAEIHKELDYSDPLAVRDATFAAVAYDLLARASELVALRWDSIAFDPTGDGSATCVIQRSKTDQEGTGSTLWLSPETVSLLNAWSAHRCPANPFVFHALPRGPRHKLDLTKPLNVREAARIFKRVAATYGIQKPLSGHSARVGAAQDMTRAGMAMPAIMQQGRWKTVTMPARYAENELAVVAGRSRRAAIDKLKRR